MYFSPVVAGAGAEDQPDLLKQAIAAATKANIAIYPIDVRGTAPAMIAQLAPTGPGGRSMTPQAATPQTGAPEISQEEVYRRRATAQAKFGSASGAMTLTYMRYGPPDQIDDRTQDTRNPLQIWRYNYLEDFHGNAELEFIPKGGSVQMKINWPPPQATYTAVADINVTLAEALDKEMEAKGGPTSGAPIAGLPGRHASFQIFPGGYRALAVPLDSLTGTVDIAAQIRTRPDNGLPGHMAAAVRDGVQASAGVYQVNFTLNAGSYL